jgi:dTDP-4-amino-4,6-dideoxygalactose transaminase
MIPVTKPFLPPKEDYDLLLHGIWKRCLLTNMGPLASELEMKLKSHLGINHILFVTNGTIALQLAIKALELEDEIITTPFTYVATTSSMVWEGCKPVYVDIDSKSLNIDPNKIEAAITDKTTAIIATHVYGNPCDVIAIDKIAKKHNLKVIYDAAHAFGVKVNGKSIFEYGDISTCSTHATKLFHTCEGGFVVTNNKELLKKIAYMRNFGHDGPEAFQGLGINGKNSEFHAAMGLANLKYIDAIHEKRKTLVNRYNENLKHVNIICPSWHKKANNNFAYHAVLFENEEILLKVIQELKNNEIFGRRYFYPSLANALPYINNQELIITNIISKRIFCLPLYFDLTLTEVDLISRLLLRALNN